MVHSPYDSWDPDELLSELRAVRANGLTPENITDFSGTELISLVNPDWHGSKSLDCVNTLFSLYSAVAFDYLSTAEMVDKDPFADASEKNSILGTMQTGLDTIVDEWLSETGHTDHLAALQSDRELRETGYSVFKVIRGMRCNQNCRFCLEQTRNADQLAFINDYADISYTQEDLLQAMLYARSSFGIREINFSGGEPLVNRNKELVQEIEMARAVGFPQITVLTNGSLLTKELIDAYLEAGLTNLTVSIHAISPENHTFLTRPKNGKSYHENVVEMARYAATTGLIVRVNVAMTKDYAESIDEWVDFAGELGIQQLTLNELIPANDFAREQYMPLSVESLHGYEKTLELAWGLTIHSPEQDAGPSLAICRFGGEDFVETQSKDIYLLPDGRLSPNLFDREQGISYKGLEG